MKKYIIVLVLVAIVFIGKSVRIDQIASNLFINKYPLISYIKQYGYFPKSENDLIISGFIRNDTKHKYQYSVKTNNTVEWYDLREYDLYSYSYGVLLEHIECKNGVVLCKKNQEPFLFISGPYSESWNNASYMAISFELYETLVTSEGTATGYVMP